MGSQLKPENADQVAEAVAWAVSEEKPLEVIGHGTKRRIGRAAQHELTLDLSGLTGITLYEPEELVLSARAGTPLSEIHRRLGEKNQELAFEPPDLSRLLGDDGGAGTVGGTVACNLGGPRRIKAGAARDHFLGVNAVSGRGETFKSGGRVVKNVTGYDLCKLLAGSWGTLAVMTDVTLKVLPAAESEETVLVTGLDPARAAVAMSAAMGSSCEVSGAAHIPKMLAASSEAAPVAAAGRDVTALRLEGVAPSIAYRADQLTGILQDHGAVERIGEADSRAFWRGVRDVHFLAEGEDRLVWRLSVPPMEGGDILTELAASHGARGFTDWAGGLVWLDLDADAGLDPGDIRTIVAQKGGHATLIRAPEAVRSSVDVFQPEADALQALSRRLKQGFDPSGILNPGRMHPSR